MKRPIFEAARRSNPEMIAFLGAENAGYTIRLPANRVWQADPPSAQSPGQAAAARGAPL